MVYKKPDKGDPSDELQFFTEFSIQVLCCRYWWLKNWEIGDISYPYWRIYWNPVNGASITHNNKKIELTPDKLVLISPNTSYSAQLFDHPVPEEGFRLRGGRITEFRSVEDSAYTHAVSHLFIHFTLGMPYDNIPPQVISIEMNPYLQEKIGQIISSLKKEHRKFDFFNSLVIRSLILELLVLIPGDKWKLITRDRRILKIVKYIETNIGSRLSNRILAGQVNMADNSFGRLFRTEIGLPPQKYIRKKRVDRARALLDHSGYSIDRIAEETGFADRYHFSRIFKREIGISPAKYRKEF